MDKKVEEIHGQLIAFYPVYTAEGNMTRLIFNTDGQKLISSSTDPRQVESVKRALARCKHFHNFNNICRTTSVNHCPILSKNSVDIYAKFGYNIFKEQLCPK
ncbi:MAG: hypothetical protein PHZ03_02285 [Syntrophomonas sp.]|nr:hypothetical protein [Syntrophomonas sp.]